MVLPYAIQPKKKKKTDLNLNLLEFSGFIIYNYLSRPNYEHKWEPSEYQNVTKKIIPHNRGKIKPDSCLGNVMQTCCHQH